jgi:DNA-binding transcriptional regulator YhcF (GntR family)
MAKKRYRSGPDAPRFIMLDHALLKCPAYRALSGGAAKLMTLMHMRHNGQNNPGVSMSIREATDEVGCSTNHAMKLFRELAAKGFIEQHSRGAFSLKNRHASTWRLLWLPERAGNGELKDAAKTFFRWSDGADFSPAKIQSAVSRGATVGITP